MAEIPAGYHVVSVLYHKMQSKVGILLPVSHYMLDVLIGKEVLPLAKYSRRIKLSTFPTEAPKLPLKLITKY